MDEGKNNMMGEVAKWKNDGSVLQKYRLNLNGRTMFSLNGTGNCSTALPASCIYILHDGDNFLKLFVTDNIFF